LIELILTISACYNSSASKISVILPCFPYARSDKKTHRGPIGAKVIIDMLTTAGADRIISMDLHSGQIQGMSSIPFDNLYGIAYISKYLNDHVFQKYQKENCILVSPDAGGIKRIKAYANLLSINYVILEKQRNYVINNVVESSILIGDSSLLNGKVCIMIDDMIDTCSTMIKGANELMKYNIRGTILVATHGIFSAQALERVDSCDSILSVIVTNTIDQTANRTKSTKLHVINISPLISQVITRLSNDKGESLSELFEDDYIKKFLEH